MLQENAFEDVGHIFTAIGALLKALIDLLPLDDGHGILFALEQPGDSVTGDAIRIVLETVDSDEAGVQIGRLTQLGDATPEFFARPVNDVRQLDRLVRRLRSCRWPSDPSPLRYSPARRRPRWPAHRCPPDRSA